MIDALVNRVKLSLNSKYYFVNNTWLKECIEYYISEHNDTGLNAVEAFVISQWILSDLREINSERSCLPPNLSSKENITLPGKYILQMDKMCDISQSKYSQLQKIRNVSEVNIKATAIETPAWEPKGKRMIQMHLTDGIQNFRAIEYRPIKALKDSLLPGCKLMIIGPVTCRKGVMLLKDENYKEIGGEVDSLLKVNALENVLARALGLEENEDPYADDNQDNKENNDVVKNETEFPEDEFDIDFDEITQIERLSMESVEPEVNNRPSNEVPNLRNNLPVNDSPKNSKDFTKSRENFSKKTTTNDFYRPQNDTGNNYHKYSQEDDRSDDFRNRLSSNTAKDRKIVSTAALKPLVSKPNSFHSRNDSSDDFNGGMKLDNHSTVPSTSSAAILADDCFDDIDFGEELYEDTLAAVENKVVPKVELGTAKNSVSPETKSAALCGGKRPADILSPLRVSPKIMCLQATPQGNKKNRKITEFTKKIVEKEDLPAKICEFICDVVKEPVLESQSFKTVRGKVIRIGNLIKKDKSWVLQATITDSTASLEITFASHILEELLGFTVKEFSEKKKLRKTNPEIEKYLRENFRKAEFKVQRMDVLMDLELTPGNSLPKVINTRELTVEQKELIDKRTRMMVG